MCIGCLNPTGQFQSEIINQVPLRRLGKVEELGNLATYLVSDYSSWITGEVVAFDGGQLAVMFNGLSQVKKYIIIIKRNVFMCVH